MHSGHVWIRYFRVHCSGKNAWNDNSQKHPKKKITHFGLLTALRQLGLGVNWPAVRMSVTAERFRWHFGDKAMMVQTKRIKSTNSYTPTGWRIHINYCTQSAPSSINSSNLQSEWDDLNIIRKDKDHYRSSFIHNRNHRGLMAKKWLARWISPRTSLKTAFQHS